MKVKFRKLQIQNFYSYGAMQEVDFRQFGSTVVLIDGIDKDTEGSKIGSGKSSFMAALTFALFGETVSNVKANEIVNYIKGKDALVILEFEIEGNMFKIERGRKPKILNIFRRTDENAEWDNISKADDKDNDDMIQQIIKMNFETFLQTSLFSVASESNKPFLNMTPAHQKKVLENIFNFDTFNMMTSEIKDKVRDEQVKLAELESYVKSTNISNDQIVLQIERLKDSSEKFEKRRAKQKAELQDKIIFYSTVNIEDEKEKYNFVDELREHKTSLSTTITELKSELKDIQSEISKEDREIEILTEKHAKELIKNKSLKGNICPTCNQDWEDQSSIENSDNKLTLYTENITSFESSILKHRKSEAKLKKSISSKRDLLNEVKEALDEINCDVDRKELDNLDIVVSNLQKEFDNISNQENHYLTEIEANEALIRPIDMTEIDNISTFILKLKAFVKLSEDPKVRGKFLRKFIKQSNDILRGFKKLIPDYNIHLQFNPDFTIRVMKLGKEVSSGSLSNGEKRIGNIMIMMALMKVFKLKNNVEFNAMFMDEVLDSGINGALLESVYTFIKNVAKEEKIRIYLISHREEIKEKVKEVIMVTKSRGISTIEINPQNVI